MNLYAGSHIFTSAGQECYRHTRYGGRNTGRHAYALVDTMAKSLLEIKAKTLKYTLGNVDSEELLDTLAQRPVGVEVEKPVDTLCDV